MNVISEVNKNMDKIQMVSMYTAYDKVVLDTACFMFLDGVDPETSAFSRPSFDQMMFMRCMWYHDLPEAVKEALFEQAQNDVPRVIERLINPIPLWG